jgi:Flp pilus assembly pilin Flp
MKNPLLRLHVTLQCLLFGTEGQDLVEYALLVCLIALAAIAGVVLAKITLDLPAGLSATQQFLRRRQSAWAPARGRCGDE